MLGATEHYALSNQGDWLQHSRVLGRRASEHAAWSAELSRAEELDTLLRHRAEVLEKSRERRIQALRSSGAKRRARTEANPIRVNVAGSVYFCGSFDDFDPRANTFLLNSSLCHLPCQLTNDREGAEVVMDAFFPAQRHNGTSGLMTLESRDFDLPAPRLLAKLTKFDLLASFSRHADVTINYFDVPPLIGGKFQSLLPGYKAAHPLPEAFLNNHSTMATFISNCGSDNNSLFCGARQRLVAGLAAENIALDHFGRCVFGGNIRELPNVPADGGTHGFLSKMQVMGAYKFAFAAENYVLYDYVTEKFYQSFLSGALPVYLGAPNAADYAPPHSFINALEYTPKELATLIRELDGDEDMFNSYFEWRRGTDSIKDEFMKLASNGYCGSTNDGLKTVCRVCHFHHKHHDWVALQ